MFSSARRPRKEIQMLHKERFTVYSKCKLLYHSMATNSFPNETVCDQLT